MAAEVADAEEAARVGLGHAARVHDVEAGLVAVVGGPAREVEVVRELGAGGVEEAVGGRDLTQDAHRLGDGRDPHDVSVLEDGAGEVAHAGVLGEVQHDPAGGPDLFKFLEVLHLALCVDLGGGGVLGGEGLLGAVARVQR